MNPAGGDYSAPPVPLAGFKDASSRQGGRQGEGKGGEGQGRRKGEEREFGWNRAAEWLRPRPVESHSWARETMFAGPYHHISVRTESEASIGRKRGGSPRHPTRGLWKRRKLFQRAPVWPKMDFMHT